MLRGSRSEPGALAHRCWTGAMLNFVELSSSRKVDYPTSFRPSTTRHAESRPERFHRPLEAFY